MEYIDNLKKTWKDFIKSLVGIKRNEALDPKIVIQEDMDHKAAVTLYNELYKGSTYQIEQVVKQIPAISPYNFYKREVGTLERIHDSIPQNTIDMLNNNVTNDFIGFEVEEEHEEVLEEIVKENDLRESMGDNVRFTQIEGEGALTINFEMDYDIPIVKFYRAHEIEIIKDKNRFKELIVKHKKVFKDKTYFIFETYGYGYIRYSVTNEDGRELKREEYIKIDPTFPLEDDEFDDNLCLGVPLYFFNSIKYPGKGKSLLEGKESSIFFLDEVVSTFKSELQPTRTILVMDEDYFPRNKEGQIKHNHILQNVFTAIRGGGMGEDKGIFNFQSELKSIAYTQAELSAKLAFLQGIASPSSLGIDTKTINESGKSQKEREKQTRFTINAIEKGLNNCYSTLLKMCIYSYYLRKGQKVDINNINVNLQFNQFGTPDWGQTAEETGKAKSLGVISTYQAVKRVNPDWTEEEIEEEVKRIQSESGMMIEDPFAINTDNMEDEDFLNLEKEPA